MDRNFIIAWIQMLTVMELGFNYQRASYTDKEELFSPIRQIHSREEF